ENEQRLLKAGLHYFASGEKVGFHTDGSIDEPTISVPEFISLYNLLINYQTPGNLYWVPFSLWDDFDAFADRFGWAVPYRVELTPLLSSNLTDSTLLRGRSVDVRIFSRLGENHPLVFFTGRVLGRQRFNRDEIHQLVAELG